MSKNKFVPTERGQTNLSGEKILDKSDSHELLKKRQQLLLLKKSLDLFVIGLIIKLPASIWLKFAKLSNLICNLDAESKFIASSMEQDKNGMI